MLGATGLGKQVFTPSARVVSVSLSVSVYFSRHAEQAQQVNGADNGDARPRRCKGPVFPTKGGGKATPTSCWREATHAQDARRGRSSGPPLEKVGLQAMLQ